MSLLNPILPFSIIAGISGILQSCTNNQNSKNLKLEKLPEAEKPRNVIFILSDDHRYDFMGFTGKVPWLKTPNMDRLASEGVYCENTFVTTSLSSPSRASILTGLYSHSHKIVDNHAPDPGNLTYFPEYLQEAGYQTGFFGKWHMGDNDDFPRPGFDHWESFKGQGEYYNPTLNINGEKIEYQDSAYITELLTNHAINWLNNRDKEKPFFLYLSHKAVHAMFKPAKQHNNKYKNEELIYPSSFTQTTTDEYKKLKWPEWIKNQRYSWHGVDYMYHGEMDFTHFFKKYCETLLGIDESIGEVMNFLKKEGLDKSTLVIYMGDNGFSFGEHGLIDKRHFYEESVKVPLLVRCPDITSGGKTIEKMIQNIDIAPTILACAGLKSPDYFHGSSFIPLLKNKEVIWRDKIFYEYYWEYDFPMTPTIHGVRTEQYKYIRYHGLWDRNEFYDLENDPFEMENLIDSPEHQEIIKQLADDIYNWLEQTDGMEIPLKRTVKYRYGDYKHKDQY
ncbi:sulfatase [Bacteroidota bacterium]